jgi:hypothetical protein
MMLIKLKNKITINSDAILSISFVDNAWCVKLTNKYETLLKEGEYEWLMTIIGHMVQINEVLAISMHAIVMFKENEEGYLIGWGGEPPIQITKEKGDLLALFITGEKKELTLSDKIEELQGMEVDVNFNKL